MKKSFIALLIVLAVAVLITPAIVGRIAERSVEDQIEGAANTNSPVIIRAESFDRGWFSSEGRHRVELRDGDQFTPLKLAFGMTADDSFPALVIDTRLDHGLIPVGALTHEGGSLEPGLGSAVSTLSIDNGNGEIIELPGIVSSTLSLSGDLESTYTLEPGSTDKITWGVIELGLNAAAQSSDYSYSGEIESFSVADNTGNVLWTDVSFSGDTQQTEYGFPVGTFGGSIGTTTMTGFAGVPIIIGPFVAEGSTSIDDGDVRSDLSMSVTVEELTGFGSVGLEMQSTMDGIDATALGRLVAAAEAVPVTPDPQQLLAQIETEAMDLLAAGGSLRIEKFDISTPQGTIRAQIDVDVKESDRAEFAWTSLLLALEAELRIEVPQVYADMAMLMAPQAEMIQGLLVQNGDIYELEAAYKRGVLTVNGAPLPIPIQ